MKGERISLIAMGLGLIFIGQPFSHILFVLGFAITFAGIVAYNFFSRNDAIK